MTFKLTADYNPSGDQPKAINELVAGLKNNKQYQLLLGATGTGKTFTMANVIEQINKPTLIVAHNKTLAGQLYSEFKEMFPENAVEYFVSYYDYYQPEAYIPRSDTYIEKEIQLNDEIDKLRHSATSSLGERSDVIVVASVSCIYGLGAPETYFKNVISLRKGEHYNREDIIDKLILNQYKRNDIDFVRATFRVKGDVIEIFPSGSSNICLRVDFFDDLIEDIYEFDPTTRKILNTLSHAAIFPASHYVVGDSNLDNTLEIIKNDMVVQERLFLSQGKLIEAQRIRERVSYNLEMIKEIGYCSGIENYSRYFDGRKPGEPPFTLIDYFPKDFLLFIDESHMTLPQIRGMYNGDRARKTNLVEYGFRLPAAYDNRPLNFQEFKKKVNQVICVSATPAEYELKNSSIIAEQLIRPTGLVDPEIFVRKTEGQIDNIISEISKAIEKKGRVLITTLTKKMAENLTNYLKENGIKVDYMHSDIDTLDRIEIITKLRKGDIDVIVGINLLREGLDIPEVNLVAILDADKEGFLRSKSSLIQTIGRAARNKEAKVIMYADKITDSIKEAIAETNRRREKQRDYNLKNNIEPKTIIKPIKNTLIISKKTEKNKNTMSKKEINSEIERLYGLMAVSTATYDFETAIILRDRISELKKFKG